MLRCAEQGYRFFINCDYTEDKTHPLSFERKVNKNIQRSFSITPRLIITVFSLKKSFPFSMLFVQKDEGHSY